MSGILDLLSWVFLVLGGLSAVVGGIGVLRLPDFYTRLHAASITDTQCALLILVGLMLQAGWTLVTVKLLMVLFFLFFTSPIASHALAKSAYEQLQPWVSKEGGESSNT